MARKTTNFSVLIIFISLFISCDFGYKKKDGKVFYKYWNAGMGIKTRTFEIEKADYKSFEKIDFACDCNFNFARDKNHFYIDGYKYNNVDPKSFNFIGNYIFADKDSAYFFGFYSNFNDCSIKGVTPDKIKLIKYPWAKAENILINGKDTVFLQNIEEFVPIDNDWGKTKTQIINKTKIVYDADVETFEATSSFQGKDKNFTYEFGFINKDNFKKVNYKSFDFANIDFCQTKPVVFVDVYDNSVSYIEDKDKPIKIVEKLKEKGFATNDIKYLDWAGESKITRTVLTNNNCDCIIEKLYSYDYSKPSDTKNIYTVTERIHCKHHKK